MEAADSTENLVNLKHIICGCTVLMFVIFAATYVINDLVAASVCCVVSILSTVLGCYALKPKIRELFCHKLRQVYVSRALHFPVVYLPKLRPLESRRQRGVVAPI